MKYWFWMLILSFSGFAQQTEVKVSDSEIQIASPFKLTYRVKINQAFPWKNKGIKYFPAYTLENSKDSAEIEVLNTRVVASGDGWQEYIFTLIPWDTGTVVLEGIDYKVAGSIISFPSDTVVVTTALLKGKKDIVDIREEFVENSEQSEEELDKNSWLYWLYTFLSIGFFCALLYWGWKKRQKKLKKEVLLSPRERAHEQLSLLKREKVWEIDQKEFYDRVSFILKKFITEEFQVGLLDKTTTETSILLKKLKLGDANIKSIEELLNSADLVKFAASTSSNDFAQDKLNSCFELIEILARENTHVE